MIMDGLKKFVTDFTSNDNKTEEEKQHEQSNKLLDASLNKCDRVAFLINAMNSAGCKIDRSFFSSVVCEGNTHTGGFHVDEHGKPGIILCQNHIPDQEWMDQTVAHELIHAYDHCRAKVDWNNCEHHACSEIRAAALSGDCNWKNEVFRKNFNIAKQHQICTRRRARLSIINNENCKGREDECIEKVFDTCYRDVSPFREIP